MWWCDKTTQAAWALQLHTMGCPALHHLRYKDRPPTLRYFCDVSVHFIQRDLWHSRKHLAEEMEEEKRDWEFEFVLAKSTTSIPTFTCLIWRHSSVLTFSLCKVVQCPHCHITKSRSWGRVWLRFNTPSRMKYILFFRFYSWLIINNHASTLPYIMLIVYLI